MIFGNNYCVGASSLNLINLAGIRSANRLLYDRFLSVERNYLVSRNNILNLLVASLYYLTRQNTVQHQESVVLKSLVHLLLCWKRRIVQESVKDGFTILLRSPLLIIRFSLPAILAQFVARVGVHFRLKFLLELLVAFTAYRRWTALYCFFFVLFCVFRKTHTFSLIQRVFRLVLAPLRPSHYNSSYFV